MNDRVFLFLVLVLLGIGWGLTTPCLRPGLWATSDLASILFEKKEEHRTSGKFNEHLRNSLQNITTNLWKSMRVRTNHKRPQNIYPRSGKTAATFTKQLNKSIKINLDLGSERTETGRTVSFHHKSPKPSKGRADPSSRNQENR